MEDKLDLSMSFQHHTNNSLNFVNKATALLSFLNLLYW